MGTSRSSGRLFTASKKSQPFIPGISKSRRIRQLNAVEKANTLLLRVRDPKERRAHLNSGEWVSEVVPKDGKKALLKRLDTRAFGERRVLRGESLTLISFDAERLVGPRELVDGGLELLATILRELRQSRDGDDRRDEGEQEERRSNGCRRRHNSRARVCPIDRMPYRDDV